MRDHGKVEAKQKEVLKQHKEIMMVVAHAVLKQDEEAQELMGEKEMMKHEGREKR
jgi:hypothetical protein